MRNFLSKPVASINGCISVPGDKSISHRAIIFGAIAQGITVVTGFLDGEDCIATLNAFKSMGVRIDEPENQKIVIHGVGKYGLKKPATEVNCGNSGTSMRLLAGLLAAQSFDSKLTGDESLLTRPMGRICKPLTMMGAEINTFDGKPPITITGGKQLSGIDYVLPQASAQVKSCLILAGIYAKNTTRITETSVSRDHTERMLAAFNYPVIKEANTLIVKAQSECKATEINVPGDISSAAFFIVAASIIPGSNIKITDVGINPTRTGILHILQAMGANIRIMNKRTFGEEPVADLEIQYAPLKGITIDSAMVPLAIDEFPIIFVAAANAKGETVVRNAKELRVKETDRIAAMVDGLQELGIKAQALADGVIINGGNMTGGTVDSRGDHRIAMSFAIAGAVANKPVVINNCDNIATSFPDFLNVAKTLNLAIGEH